MDIQATLFSSRFPGGFSSRFFSSRFFLLVFLVVFLFAFSSRFSSRFFLVVFIVVCWCERPFFVPIFIDDCYTSFKSWYAQLCVFFSLILHSYFFYFTLHHTWPISHAELSCRSLLSLSKGSPFFSNKYLKLNLAVPKHKVLVLILKSSGQCFHSIG